MTRTTLCAAVAVCATVLAVATPRPRSSLISPALLATSSQADAVRGGIVALTNARIIDGTGGAPIEGGTLVITSGRIAGVGPAAAVTIPASAQRIDGTGKTIVPGFVNAHGHLNGGRGSGMPVRDRLVRQLQTYGAYGVTSVMTLGSGEADEIEGIRLMQEQDRAGLDRARLYTAGQNAEGRTPEEARRSVERLAGVKAHAVKFHINGTPNDMEEATWSAIIDESTRRGLLTAVHIFNLKDAAAAVERGVNVIAHSVRDQDVDQRFIERMREREVGYVPTLTRDLSVFVYETTPTFLSDPFFLRGQTLYGDQVPALVSPQNQERVGRSPTTAMIKNALVQAERNLKLLNDAGVLIAMGTDSGAGAGRWQGYFEHVEMEMMHAAGLSPMQVLAASTANAAKIFGLTQVGTLQSGKWADFVVLTADPLDDIRNTRAIDSVWIAGARLPDGAPPRQSR